MTLKLKLTSGDPTTSRADALGIVCFQGEEPMALAALDEAFSGAFSVHLKTAEFSGKLGQLVELPTLGRIAAPRLLLVGVGPRGEGEGPRLASALATVVRGSLGTSPSAISVVLPKDVGSFRCVAEGVVLGAYRFTKYLTGERRPKRELERVDIFAQGKVGQAEKDGLELGQAIAEAVCVARDAVNEPPNVLYPESFAELCRQVAKQGKLKLKVLDEKGLRAAGHGLHVAVGQGSAHGPHLMHLTYAPKNPKRRIVFVGKGVTFDSGGLCIKPMQGMADMKTDMAGAAAVLGLMQAVAAVGPDVEVHGIIGAAENMPDGNAYRPADVLSSLSGKTVEIINTDAEGRLVLADALTYAARLEPDAIVDAATLTGATLVSLGQPYSAFFSNSDELASAMEKAAREAGESFWRMPLIEELSQQLKSDIADYKHVGDRFGGAISAALFLREFVDGIPWIHCDIPGAVYGDRPSGVYPKGGTGHAVMTFLRLVEVFSQISLGAPPKPQATRRRRGTPAAPTRRAPVRKPRVRGKTRRG